MRDRTSRLRLLVEGAVVVVSVLFAFGIEAAWSARQARGELEALVEFIRADLEWNISELNRRKAISETHVAQLNELYLVIHDEVPRPPTEALELLVLAAFQNNPLSPDLAAYEASAGAPAWDLVPPEIKLDLTRVRNSNTTILGPLQVEALIRLTDLAAKHGGVTALTGQAPETSRFEPDYDGLLGEPEFEAWLTQHIVVEEYQQRLRLRWIERLGAIDRALAAL